MERATQLAEEQGVPNANFQVMNALDMSFEDDSFDIIWACESGEHMPDKGKYIEEMTRVLKPGGWVNKIDAHDCRVTSFVYLLCEWGTL